MEKSRNIQKIAIPALSQPQETLNHVVSLRIAMVK